MPDAGGSSLALDGQYLFGLSTFLRPEFPILFGATITLEPAVTPTDEKAATMTLVLQPLYCKNEGGAAPNCTREKVGEPLVPFVFDIAQDGRFSADLGEVTVGGDSNPVSGRDIKARLILKGFVREHEICGGVEGEILLPIQAPLTVDANRFGTVHLGAIGDTADFRTGPVRYDCAPAVIVLALYDRQLQADGRSPHTVGSYMRGLRLLAAHLGNIEIRTVTSDHIARFILPDAVQKQAGGTPKAANSVNHTRTAVHMSLAPSRGRW